jgi:ferrous iron transport protein B
MSSAPETSATQKPETVRPTAVEAKPRRVVLIGNPNVGKSVIFGFLTGRYVTVSNYPGTTVTITRGKADIERETLDVIDTPGVNSLIPMSEDERVTRDILLENPNQAVIQVADAKNLRRALLITSQLAEMGIPFALDLNMTDEAGNLGVRIDRKALEAALGVPVSETVAVRRKGMGGLRRAIANQRSSELTVTYPRPVEEAIREITHHLPDTPVSKRSLAVMILAGDESLIPWLGVRRKDRSVIEIVRRRCAARVREPLGTVINKSRLVAVDTVVKQVEVRPRLRVGSVMDTLGQWAMHPVWGIPVLLVVLWGMYQFVGVFGAGTAVDFLESTVFGKYLSPWAMQISDFLFRFPHTHAFEDGVMAPNYSLTGDLAWWQEGVRFVHDFLVGPYGQITMALSYAIALILPIVATFFIAFGILEDSGYLPRLAVMVNRIFHILGLNGKAVLPMVLGLGCDTMATLTTRILETKKERILVTLLLALGVPCSAQLGVILGMIRALSLGATLVWVGSILVTLFVVGWLAARLVPGQSSDFILELPPIRRPQLGNIVVKTMARIEWYMREAVPLFLLGTLILFFMDAFRLLGLVEKAAAPVIQGVLGLPAQAAEAFLIGFLRRDYGAAGLYDLSRQGQLDSVQLIVAMVTITLFVPCIANFMIMIKERGAKIALAMVAFIVPMAFLVGGILNWGLRGLGVTF